jgi:lipase chaperone LimK
VITLRWNKRTGLATLGLLGLLGLVLWTGWGPAVSDTGKASGLETRQQALSLAGTAPDGLVALQAGALNPLPGQCLPAGCSTLAYGELKRLFDYYLSTVGEQTIPAITRQIQQVLAENLRPAQLPQAQRLLDRYIAFKAALLQLEQDYAKKPEAERSLRARFLAMQGLRDHYFSAEETQAMFGLEDANDMDALARLEIANDATLSASDKRSRLAALDQHMPRMLREDREAPRAVIRLEEHIAALRAQGAGDDEVFRARAKALDTAAAGRLAELDQEERQWRQRIESYLSDRTRALQRLADAPDSEKQAALADLQQARFNELERKRLAAYEP